MATGLHHKYALSRSPSRSLLLFYAYRPVLQSSSASDEAQAQLCKCIELDLTGRLLVADEGINGTVGGTSSACEAYIQWMCQVREKVCNFIVENHTSCRVVYGACQIQISNALRCQHLIRLPMFAQMLFLERFLFALYQN